MYVLLLAAAFSFRVVIARFYPTDTAEDGKVYAQLARNLLEQRVYSAELEPPYPPTFIRLPGYPLFLAGVYSIFGHYDDGAVRIVQALIDTATCGLIALIAFLWEPEGRRKRRTSIAALALAAACPFQAIYVGTLLTETLTMFAMIAALLTATFALKSTKQQRGLWLWIVTGLICGIAVLLRPDSALLALAIGITLVVSILGRGADVQLKTRREELLYRSARASYLGAVFSLAFCLVLVPWTIRNYRQFRVFQPLAPLHAEMPGDFVPRGYFSWVRTWIDDGRYLGPALWSLDAAPISITDFPDRAFDSAAEKQHVAALLERYNQPLEELTNEQVSEEPPLEAEPEGETESEPSDQEADEEGTEEAEQEATDEQTAADRSREQLVEMTPEIDANFARLARERVSRNPLRYYVWLPLKRAHALWFNTHSQFYPFEGELLPFGNLDHKTYQQYWLPLFAALTAACTLLGIAGSWILWQARDSMSRLWLLLAVLFVFLRLGFFAALETPDPRYTVEIFPLLSILGGLAVARIDLLLKTRRRL